ncbi:MAG: hypothetical protein ACI4ED_06225 [Suilimivivens sp.]
MQNNSSRTGLFLMELIIALLFFSLAGAVCIQLFVQSHLISNKSVVLNHSVLWVQNAAETFYGCNGDINEMAALLGNCIVTEDEGSRQLTMRFDKDFNPIESTALMQDFPPFNEVYILKAVVTSTSDLLLCHITMENSEETELLYSLNVSLFPDKEVFNEQ